MIEFADGKKQIHSPPVYLIELSWNLWSYAITKARTCRNAEPYGSSWLNGTVKSTTTQRLAGSTLNITLIGTWKLSELDSCGLLSKIPASLGLPDSL